MCRSAERLGFLRLAFKIVPLLFFCAAASVSHAQVDPVVCSAGDGSFESAFPTGVKVEVGAARRDGMAVRMCQGALLWDKKSLVVAPSAFEVDIDAFGIDLSLGTPVVTFQVKEAQADCCSTLLVYSLQKPPKLLHTVTGGGFYNTSDKNLNGEVQIWTSDASSLIGFESPVFSRSELAPPVVLRFVHGKLLNVGSEFQNYFDEDAAKARSQLTPEDLRAFQNSDGRLASTAHFSQEEQRASENLLRTKLRVLQIVWAYLYSGREQEAWKTLAELWPPADLERIKAEMIRARGQGILSHVDGASTAGRPPANTVKVFDLRIRTTSQALPASGGRRVTTPPPTAVSNVASPVPIFIAHQAVEGETEDDLPASEMLDLTIDSAGKVRSVVSTDPAFAAKIKDDTAGWKFIPAMSDGQAVASRVYMVVSPKR